jgi:hypothetical protein
VISLTGISELASTTSTEPLHPSTTSPIMPKRAPKRFKAQTEDEKAAAAADQAGPSTSKPSPRLFHPFRALGFVCDHVPMSIFTHSAKGALSVPHVNIVTSVGRSWMMWEAGRMGLVFVGTSFDSFIMRRGRGTNG